VAQSFPGFERKRGRENGSFPVAEILKPMGFKESRILRGDVQLREVAHMNKKQDALFCVGQKAFIEKYGEVLILNDPIEGLDFPGGKVQVGETDFGEALKREVREETNLEIKIGDPFTIWYNEFFPPHRNAGKKVYLVGFRCEYVSGEIKLSDEHDWYKWVTKENYREVQEDSDYFRALEKYFAKG
jgi:8-oxo-dGTP diphosphatase